MKVTHHLEYIANLLRRLKTAEDDLDSALKHAN